MKSQYALTVDYRNNLFRSLNGKEEEAVTVMDNRNIFGSSSAIGANNDVLIVCDHSSNDLKGLKGTRQEEDKVRSQDAYDVNAADLACALSERLECMAVMTSFSKLIIDPSLPICN